MAGGERHIVTADGWQVTAETQSIAFYVEEQSKMKTISLYRNWEWIRELNG